jgi:hypothetical protein
VGEQHVACEGVPCRQANLCHLLLSGRKRAGCVAARELRLQTFACSVTETETAGLLRAAALERGDTTRNDTTQRHVDMEVGS